MFISRASRHDRDDIKALIEAQGWDAGHLAEGTTLIAREGSVTGCVRLVEVAPQTVVIDDFLVREDRRGQGLGRKLMQAAMNNRGGTLYLCCHDDVIAFYEKLGFAQTPYEELPAPVKEYFERVESAPDSQEYEHFFLKAR